MPLGSKLQHLSRLTLSTLRALGKPKVFCIGKNKTGTTSLGKALTELGVTVGEQAPAERLIHEWARRDFRKLFRHCHTAQAFQDVPFSWPFTYQALDQRFPGSRFILTVRDTPEQWYRSMMAFYVAVIGNGKTVTLNDFRTASYVYPGWAYEARQLVISTPEDDPFNMDICIDSYKSHNAAVQEYFRHRPHDLLVLNVAQPGAYDRLCDFLGRARSGKQFPWENKTEDLMSKQDPLKK